MTAACAALAMTFPVRAGVIAVVNPSFETLPAGGLPLGACGAGCSYSEDAIPGWLVTGNLTGQFQPGVQAGNFAYFNSVPDGITVAYTDGGSISQTVAATVALGVTYTLSVDQGVRHDNSDPGIIELLIGGNAPIIAAGIPASPGDWSTYTATYTGLAGDIGKSISIELFSSDVQGDWDNVRLSNDATTGVPEPTTLTLFGAGFAGIGAMRRRKKAS